MQTQTHIINRLPVCDERGECGRGRAADCPLPIRLFLLFVLQLEKQTKALCFLKDHYKPSVKWLQFLFLNRWVIRKCSHTGTKWTSVIFYTCIIICLKWLELTFMNNRANVMSFNAALWVCQENHSLVYKDNESKITLFEMILVNYLTSFHTHTICHPYLIKRLLKSNFLIVPHRAHKIWCFQEKQMHTVFQFCIF